MLIDVFEKIFGAVFSLVVEGLLPRKKIVRIVKDNELVIDVRSTKEFAESHFKRSINIPLDKIDSLAKKYDKNMTIIVCCVSGRRSKKARIRLQDLGFENVENAKSWTNLK